MQNKLKYGVDFLRDLKLIAPKVSRKKALGRKKSLEKKIPLEDQLNSFKEFHNIPDDFQIDADFRVVDGKLSTLLNDKYVPLVQHGKPLANSTLQGKYGAALLRRLGVPTIKHQTPELLSKFQRLVFLNLRRLVKMTKLF